MLFGSRLNFLTFVTFSKYEILHDLAFSQILKYPELLFSKQKFAIFLFEIKLNSLVLNHSSAFFTA